MYILFFLLLVKMTVVVFLLTPTDLLGAVCEMFFSQKNEKGIDWNWTHDLHLGAPVFT